MTVSDGKVTATDPGNLKPEGVVTIVTKVTPTCVRARVYFLSLINLKQ